jgi:glutamate dehydrogenase (NAD(P)+)
LYKNKNGEFWELEDVLIRLEKILYKMFKKVLEISRERNVDMRTASYIIAIQRIEQSYLQRGILPLIN